MLGKSGVCNSCRRALKIPLPPRASRRFASSKAEPYVLSPLVIDLDDADSKYVRQFEESEYKEIEWLHNLKKDLPKRSKDPTDLEYKKPSRDALRTLCVNPMDLLSYALLGSPLNLFNHKPGPFHDVFRYNGLQQDEGVKTTMERLLHNFSTDPQQRLKYAGYSDKKADRISRQINECDVFFKLERAVSMLSSTRKGCHFLVAHCAEILESIRLCRKAQEEKENNDKVGSERVLILLNSIYKRADEFGILPGPILANAGIYYAAKTFNLSAIRMYLNAMLQNSYSSNWRTGMALSNLVRKILIREPLSNRMTTPENIEFARKEAIKVITGHKTGNAVVGSISSSPSFADLLYHDKSEDFDEALYPRYILGLAELGMSDALQAEWEIADERFPPALQGDRLQRFRAQIFAYAFLIAGDSKRASSVLESIPQSAPVYSGDVDPQDDWPQLYWHDHMTKFLTVRPRLRTSENHTPIGPFSSSKWLTMIIEYHLRFRRLNLTKGLYIIMSRMLNDMPTDPQEALEILDLFALPKSSVPLESNKFHLLMCVVMDGQVGLRVLDGRAGKKILLWRPIRKELFEKRGRFMIGGKVAHEL